MSVCPACGEQVPEQARYCQACGTALLGTPQVAMEERRIVTALFCDLVGFTARSDLADPEEIMATVRPFYGRVRADIEAFGGTVQKFIGDAVVGVFGARTAHEDDPERAVRAALRILDSIEELNRTTPDLQGLSVRVGVNTGEVVVPSGPTTQDNEILAIGDAVNVASRLQSMASQGTAVVGRATYDATHELFRYEQLEPVQVKGKAEPLTAWRAVEPLARVGADVARALTGPFVGRERELDLLQDLFARVVQDTAPASVTILADAGVGKSRLVGELLRHLDARPELITWRQGRCLPYGDGVTFWALSDIVKAQLGIQDTDPPIAMEAKLDAGLRAADTEREWMKARVAPLIGLELGAPAQREEQFTAWRRFLESICLTGPAIFVIEDLHWGDEALIAFLEELMHWAVGIPMLLLCTARPEMLDRFPHWPGPARNATMISLRPLSDEQIERLLARLLEDGEVPEGAQSGIVERAGGNPLYAKEYVHLLRDRGQAAPLGEALPATVQAIIAARLDTLSPMHRAIVQSAAVIGKVFWSSAVLAVDGVEPAALDEGLRELTRRELVRRSHTTSMQGEEEYAFWHALLPDVAYRRLPRAVRARRHAALVRWLEAQVGHDSLDLAGVVAHHAVQALDLAIASGWRDAVEELTTTARAWLTLAGDAALPLDVTQAERFYGKAAALVKPGDPARGPLFVRVADAARQAGHYEASAAAFDEAVKELRASGDLRGAGRASVLAANVLRHMNDAGAEDVLFVGVALLEAEPPGPELVEAYSEVAGHEYVLGSFGEAIGWANKALDLARDLGVDAGTRALGFRGAARCLFGDAAGLEDLREALSIGLRTGAGRDTALVYANLAGVSWLVEGPKASMDVYEDGIGFARRRGITEFALITEAASHEALFDLGRWDEVLASADRLDAPMARTRAELDLLFLRTVRAHVLAERGRLDEASAVVAEIAAPIREDGAAQLMVPAFTVEAMCRAARGDLAGAGELIDELLAMEGIGFDPNCLPYLPTLAELAVAAGRIDAVERLAESVPATTARHRAVGTSIRAVVAEAHGDPRAAAVYASAAQQWRQLGVLLEEAVALAGECRCSVASGVGPDVASKLARAREIFELLGAADRLARLADAPT